MKKAFVLSALCTLLFLFTTGGALAQDCDRAVADRVETAQALLNLNAGNYASVIDYWAEDITYQDPFLTNVGRGEMLEYLDAMFAGTAYGFPNDRAVTIKDELSKIDDQNGDFVYIATLEWSGTFGTAFFIQTGMSIIKFRSGEGCPYFHRDYYTEGDTWWNIPDFWTDTNSFRNIYITMFGLGGRCFDGDGDGYTKYANAKGCPNAGLDCNDFVAEINPGATEIPGNGIDDDCKVGTPDEPACAVFPVNSDHPAALLPFFVLFLAPAAFIFVVRRRVTRK